MKQIKVSDKVHEQIKQIRDDEGHTSFDSAIRSLIHGYSYENAWRNPSVLRELHHNEEMTIAEMAREFGCTPPTVSRWMERHGIEKVPNDPRSQAGETHWNYNGGKSRKYGSEWEQRREIYRDRNSMQCVRCGKENGENDRQNHLHHLDESVIDASDVKDSELIPLCPSCHSAIEVNGFDITDDL